MKTFINRSTALLATLIFCAMSTLFAQSPPGKLSGTVKDAKGTLVPGVTVTATQIETGKKYETYSNDDGQFVFAGLPGGTYRVDAEIISLPKAAQDGINVVSLQEAHVDLVLGRVQLKPKVEGVPGAEKSEPGKNPNTQRPGPPPSRPGQAAGSTPGNRRQLPPNFQNLTLLTNPDVADVTQSAPAAAGGENGGMGLGPDSGGQNVAENFLINGSVNTGAFQLTQNGPGDMGDADRMERVREFMRNADPALLDRIQQMAGAGGFGGFGGGPGFGGGGRMGGPGGPGGGGRGGFGGFGGRNARVNKIQGNFFMNYRNSVFDAKPYSFQGVDQSRPSYIRNNFGGSVGGPLNIPHVYKSRDRTSFFFNWQSQRSKDPFATTTTVPTLAERNGDFSQTVFATGPNAGQIIPIFDPQSPVQSRQQFPNNQIPLNRIDPAAQGLLKFIPLPNLPGQSLNFHFEQSLSDITDNFSGRIDHKLTNKDNLSFSYNFRRSDSLSSQGYPDLSSTTSSRGQNFSASYTHTFNDRLLNEVRYQFNRLRFSVLNNFAFVNDVAGQLGITGASSSPIDFGPPTVSFTNFGPLSLNSPVLRRNQTSHISDNLTVIRGKHSLRFGFEFRRIELNTTGGVNGRGNFVFSGFSTAAFDPQGQALANTGFDLADFLLGLPQSTSLRFGGDNVYFRSNVYAGYIQDNWRVKPRLTLSLGLRYEIFTPLTEKFDRIANLDIAPNFTDASAVLPGQTGPFFGVFPQSLINGDYNNLSPRFGFAWRPFAKKRTVVRGSYGIFFIPSIYNQLYPQLASQPPFAVTSQLLTSPQSVLTLENGFPLNPNPGVTIRNSFAVDPNYQVGYVQQWNLLIQHELTRSFVVSVGYLGTKGTKLDLLRAPNRAAPGSSLTTQERLQIGNAEGFLYDTSGASSIFHALQVRVQRRMTKGFAVQGMYIFGKSIDDASSIGGAGGGTVVQDENNLRADRGLSSFDVRHRVILNGTYEFPFGDRKRWLSKRSFLADILGDWQASANAIVQSGNYYTPRVLGSAINNSGTGANQSERSDYNGLPISLPPDQQTIDHFFNTVAFLDPPPGSFGDAGRNIIPGPGLVNLNMALNKIIRTRWEGKRIEFRTQIQNVFNHPNFTGLNTVVDSTNFGRLTSTRGMRTVEFNLRFRF
ncbi:MAG: TonB-dependent receptor [Acidobacteriia bacterium]|nr:TonB-dependent receptor [Terriglobia bacterium]